MNSSQLTEAATNEKWLVERGPGCVVGLNRSTGTAGSAYRCENLERTNLILNGEALGFEQSYELNNGGNTVKVRFSNLQRPERYSMEDSIWWCRNAAKTN